MIDWQQTTEVPAPNDDTFVLTFSPGYALTISFAPGHKETHDMHYRIMRGLYIELHPEIAYWVYLEEPSQDMRKEWKFEDTLTEEEWIGAQEASIKSQWSSQ